MANYYASARTNLFKVKNKEAFEKEMKLFYTIELIWENANELVLCFDEGGIPHDFYDDKKKGFVEIDWKNIMSRHLQVDSVVVFMEVGAEKLRYLTGTAFAIDSTGKMVYTDLSEIYGKAKTKFGKTPTEI